MKRRLLLVDDEPSILDTLKELLETCNFEVETAPSAEEGIAKIKAGSYDLVITDLRMEHDESGYDVLRAARATDYQPPVAILTAFPLLAHDWKRRGAQSLLLKPMRVKEMVREIETIIAAHEASKLMRESPVKT